MARGSENQFNEIVNQLAKNIKNYDTKSVNYIKFLDTVDYIFAEYGWSKSDFYAEMNARLNPHNKPKPKAEKPVKPKKRTVRKKST